MNDASQGEIVSHLKRGGAWQPRETAPPSLS